jgi:hypothetical protein
MSCMTKDFVPINVDMRFSSVITNPEKAVNGEAPLDLWKYLEDTFLTILSDYM